MKATLFIPCLIDQFYPDVGLSVVNILQKSNVDIYYPSEQTCCGQPAFNTGYFKYASKLAERFIKIFSDAEYIVSPSGSCVSMVRSFYPKLDINPSLSEKLRRITSRIYEFSEFLIDVLKFDSNFQSSIVNRQSSIVKVAYHPSCHLLRELKVKSAPIKLLKMIKSIELVELPDSEDCCGFGGTFAVKFPELSSAIGNDKVQSIINSNADCVVMNDASCIMQISGILSRRKIPIKVLHIAEIISASFNL